MLLTTKYMLATLLTTNSRVSDVTNNKHTCVSDVTNNEIHVSDVTNNKHTF